MAKGNYLSGILFIAALLFCGSTAGFRVSRGPQLTGNPEPATHNSLTISKVRRIYNSQIGVREQHANTGPQVEKYLSYAGLAKGQPWCAAFVCWVYESAGVTNPRTGWSPDLFPASKIIWERTGNSQLATHNLFLLPVAGCVLRGWTDKENVNPFLLPVTGCLLRGGTDKQNVKPFLLPVAGCVLRGGTDKQNVKLFLLPVTGCLLRGWTDNENINFTQHNPQLTRNTQPATHNSQPTTADIFAIYFPDKRRIAHTGFIDSWDGSWLITVEGNTNETGRREGDGVYRKRRLVRSIYQVARYID